MNGLVIHKFFCLFVYLCVCTCVCLLLILSDKSFTVFCVYFLYILFLKVYTQLYTHARVRCEFHGTVHTMSFRLGPPRPIKGTMSHLFEIFSQQKCPFIFLRSTSPLPPPSQPTPSYVYCVESNVWCGTERGEGIMIGLLVKCIRHIQKYNDFKTHMITHKNTSRYININNKPRSLFISVSHPINRRPGHN